MLVPLHMTVDYFVRMEYCVLTVVKCKSGEHFLIVNVYIPPASSSHSHTSYTSICNEIDEAIKAEKRN